MYETEANRATADAAELPSQVLRAFAEADRPLVSRTVLAWSEHCTECVWPTCYTTCDLYSPRPDGRCRRFTDGMVRLDAVGTANGYLLRIRFKRWGKLWTPGNIRLRAREAAARAERRDSRIGRAVQAAPLPSLVTIAAAKKLYGFKKRMASAPASAGPLPTSFLIECYNPAAHEIPLSLTMRATEEGADMPFQKLIPLAPGFHRVRIATEEIAPFLDLRQPFGIELIPNAENDGTTLYFGLMEFVTELPQAVRAETQAEGTKGTAGKTIKCVVWDLDHTLWDGILVEDGIDRLRLKPGAAEVIRALDQRGILHSVASKNNPEEAMRAIRRFGLEDYFLCPQISWQPKSQSIQAIAQQLNLGLDSLLFIDDSAFEREEVRATCPAVRLLAAEHYLDLPQREECQVPVTAESRERRRMYQVEAGRQAMAQNFSHDYMAFLRHCQIQLTVRPMTEENLERVHELTQRTNQMNFSGNRYDRDVLRQLLADPGRETFVLACQDRFGSYGVVGFSVVDRREPRMIDLMFSCRIQSKRVEHAFLSWLMRRYIGETGRDFHADYRKTSRNAPSGKVFSDLGMEEEASRTEGVLSLRFPRDRQVPDDGVIEILVEGPANSGGKITEEESADSRLQETRA
jgi:FkbH-like protein